MKKVIIVAVVVLIAAVIILFLRNSLTGIPFFGPQASVEIQGTTIQLDVVDTEEERQKGLSGRDSLPDDRGMLFVFDEPGMYNFWMKDMRFPIDIIFLNDNRIITIHSHVQPPQSPDDTNLPVFTSSEPADRVLELNAGKAEQLGLEEGNTIPLNL